MIKNYNYKNKKEMEKIIKDVFNDNKFVLHNDYEIGKQNGKLTVTEMPIQEETEIDLLKNKIKNGKETPIEFKNYIKHVMGLL
jgi:hypothetical protein